MISNSRFVIDKFQSINPLSYEFQDYWKDIKKNCIDGLWVDNIWIPPTLYFFANIWTIKLQNLHGKGEYIGRPDIRPDLEWEKHLIFTEAKGFSGFELDKEYSCDRTYLDIIKLFPKYYTASDDELIKIKEELYQSGVVIKDIDFRKKYIDSRSYLRQSHNNLGKALYKNDAKNIIEIGCRGFGKSYNSAACIAHTFLFDGATDYESYLNSKKIKKPLSAEICIGAIDSKFSKDLCDKVLLGLEHLPGECEYNNIFYPSPFYKSFTGSLDSGKKITAVRDIKKGDNWIKVGSRSKIHHRTTGENPYIFNGTRPLLVALEEVGFMHNLLETLGNLKDCTTINHKKFGSVWCFGTGGSMESGASMAAQKVFYNPERYDCLVFDNIYESNGPKNIGYFVPATKVINEYRDNNGILNEDLALKKVLKDREKAKSKSPKEYNNLLQNNPLAPSEAFLVLEGNKFPIGDLKDQLGYLLSDSKLTDASYKVEFKINQEGKIEYVLSGKTIIKEYPYRNDLGTDTAIELFELPKKDNNGNVYNNRYIAGWDPTEDDGKVDGDHSLQSGFIFDLWTDSIVVEYTGRTYINKDWYEQWRRCLIYYNAICSYEKDKKGPYQYFEQKKSLNLFAETPNNLQETGLQSVKAVGNETYGIRATKPIISYGIDLIAEWLDKSWSNEKKKLHSIRSIALIQELIKYSPTLNCDRTMALVQLFILREDKIKYLNVDELKNKVNKPKKDFWAIQFYKKSYGYNYQN